MTTKELINFHEQFVLMAEAAGLDKRANLHRRELKRIRAQQKLLAQSPAVRRRIKAALYGK